MASYPTMVDLKFPKPGEGNYVLWRAGDSGDYTDDAFPMLCGHEIMMRVNMDTLHEKEYGAIASFDVAFPSGERRMIDTKEGGWSNITYSNMDDNRYVYEDDSSFLRITFRIKYIDDSVETLYLKCRQNYEEEAVSFKLVGCSLKNDGYGSYIFKRGDEDQLVIAESGDFRVRNLVESVYVPAYHPAPSSAPSGGAGGSWGGGELSANLRIENGVMKWEISDGVSPDGGDCDYLKDNIVSVTLDTVDLKDGGTSQENITEWVTEEKSAKDTLYSYDCQMGGTLLGSLLKEERFFEYRLLISLHDG